MIIIVIATIITIIYCLLFYHKISTKHSIRIHTYDPKYANSEQYKN